MPSEVEAAVACCSERAGMLVEVAGGLQGVASGAAWAVGVGGGQGWGAGRGAGAGAGMAEGVWPVEDAGVGAEGLLFRPRRLLLLRRRLCSATGCGTA